MSEQDQQKQAATASEEEDLYPHNHLFVFTPSNPFRRACVAISTSSRAFDYLILLAILPSCVILAANDHYPNDNSKFIVQLKELEVYFVGIFCAEAFFKIVSQGFILHPNSFMRSGWNIFDFIVVVTSILPYVGLNDVGPINVVKAARVLRSLQGFSRVLPMDDEHQIKV